MIADYCYPQPLVRAWISNVILGIILVGSICGACSAEAQGLQFVGHGLLILRSSCSWSDRNHSTTKRLVYDTVVKTTGAGEYTVPYLKPGTYTVTATMAGFKTVSKTHMVVSNVGIFRPPNGFRLVGWSRQRDDNGFKRGSTD